MKRGNQQQADGPAEGLMRNAARRADDQQHASQDDGDAHELAGPWHLAQHQKGDEDRKQRRQIAERTGDCRADPAVGLERQQRHRGGEQAAREGKQQTHWWR